MYGEPAVPDKCPKCLFCAAFRPAFPPLLVVPRPSRRSGRRAEMRSPGPQSRMPGAVLCRAPIPLSMPVARRCSLAAMTARARVPRRTRSQPACAIPRATEAARPTRSCRSPSPGNRRSWAGAWQHRPGRKNLAPQPVRRERIEEIVPGCMPGPVIPGLYHPYPSANRHRTSLPDHCQRCYRYLPW